jgi:hypothetical protein
MVVRVVYVPTAANRWHAEKVIVPLAELPLVAESDLDPSPQSLV